MSCYCYFCKCELGGLVDGDVATINGCHWTGTEYIRVDLCGGCYDAGRLARAPRRPRQTRRRPVYAATDWNMLVAFSKRK